jgi:hypothetical protein
MADLRSRYWLDKKAKRGFKGFPVATVAFYGPDNQSATKVAVGIVNQQQEVILMGKWFSKDYEDVDVRFGSVVIQRVLDFIAQQDAQSVVISEGIIGCPHEEGLDYPEGEVCPECPFWANRDRWA